MATGRDDDALLGPVVDVLTSESILNKIRSTMDTAVTGIKAAGDVFPALPVAGPRSVVTDQPSTSSKHLAAFIEEREADDFDDCEYCDIENIFTSGTSGAKAD